MAGNLNGHDDWSASGLVVPAAGTVTSTIVRNQGASLVELLVGSGAVTLSASQVLADGTTMTAVASVAGPNAHTTAAMPAGMYVVSLVNSGTAAVTAGVVAIQTLID